MRSYKKYLYIEGEKIPRCTRLKRLRAATQSIRNRRNRKLHQLSRDAVFDDAVVTDQETINPSSRQEMELQESSSNNAAEIDVDLNMVNEANNDASVNDSESDSENDDSSEESDGDISVSGESDNREVIDEQGSHNNINDSVGDHFNDKHFDVFASTTHHKDHLCACANVSAADVMVMVLTLGLRHNLSWVAQIDILKMINTIYGCEKVPSSKYNFLKHVENRSTGIDYHFFCSNKKCGRYLGDNKYLQDSIMECQCGQSLNTSNAQSFFVSLSLVDQFNDLLKDNTVAESIFSHRFNRLKTDADAIEDIYDGTQYKKHLGDGGLLANPHNFSYSFNTDGMPIGKSSRKTLWPIYVTINELPHKDRDKYVCLAGLYVGDKDPDQNMFLEPFVDQANKLSNEGFWWKYQKSDIHSYVIPLISVVDSVARYQMLNMTCYSAEYGCTFCYIKSEKTCKRLKFTIRTEPIELRTLESTIDDVKKAAACQHEVQEKNRTYRGVKGPSPLLFLNHFSLISGFVPDYMHAILQGVIKTHMELLFDSTRKKFWIGMNDRIAMDHMKNAVDERLLSIAPPKIVTKLPRSLHEMAQWKAADWRAWLVLYCIPCLKGLLKKKHVNHLSLLCTAVSILLEKSLKLECLRKAELLLLRYVFLFQKHFKPENMVYNVHLLTHLVKGIRDWGPMFTHNCFLYESQNRLMLQMFHSPNQVVKQLVRKFLTFGALPSLIAKLNMSEDAIEFCENILHRSLKVFMNVGEITLVGRAKWPSISEDEDNILQSANLDPNCTEFYDVMVFQYSRFTTESFTIGKKNNNSYIYLHSHKFGQIRKILRDIENNKVYLLIRLMKVSKHPVCLDESEVRTYTPLFEVIERTDFTLIVPKDIADICIFMDSPSGSFICSVPYGCRSGY